MTKPKNSVATRARWGGWMFPAWISVVFAFASASPYVISFLDSAIVEGSSVRLAEVAKIQGRDPEKRIDLANTIVSNFLLPGRVRNISTNHIVNYCLRGWSEEQLIINNPGVIAVRMGTTKILGTRIEEKVMNHIQTHMNRPRENVKARIVGCPDRVILPKGEYEMRVSHPLTFDWIGPARFRVDFVRNGDVYDSETVSANLEVMEKICVAARQIGRNSTVKADDVMLQMRNITRMRHSPILDSSEIIGQRARRTIRPGRDLNNTMFEPVPLVNRGDPVKIQVSSGSARISADAISRSDGKAGDVIPVLCLATRRILKGRVRSDGRIIIENSRR